MPQIRFTQGFKIPKDMVNVWDKYILGSVHSVSNDEAERWLRRGVAEFVNNVQEIVKETVQEVVFPPKLEVAETKEEKKIEETILPKVVEENKVEEITETISTPNLTPIPRVPRR